MIGLLIWIGLLIATIPLVVFGCAYFADENAYFKGSVCVAAALLCLYLAMYPIIRFDDAQFERTDPYVTHQIVALQDNSMFSGRYHLRSGYFNEKHCYLYGYKTNTGGMKTQKVNADQTTVYFTDDVSPQAKWYKETSSFWYLTSSRYTCDIFVPTGSLVSDYTIDLQ